ncbi:tRNA uracil 4-sulfurtransferase ThiI [Zobellella taiwanensis]|jgi:thiamine biosynthesis protein ThiI|uniref:tRNA sulfurtransferase n=1 Tax=Zobellella taiwanensis TaxID=347535 RepID=A0A2P7R5E2_9GAMM|nr:tRNA uracil 4-sulfurtransferase ThiI [Zobellella taiwanensis]PSJ45435.1 tRNA 4-thiouridine(8) synthase ThiI [Zobellella taiwanensis]
MKFIIKLHPEITIKSKSVRQRMSKILQGNIRNVLKPLDEHIKIRADWDKLIVRSNIFTDEHRAAMVAALSCIPGIQSFLEVKEFRVDSLDDILTHTQAMFGEALAGKTFCVRAKRRGQQSFSSLDVERYVGGGLNQRCETGGVKLKQPDVQVNLELDGDRLYLVSEQHAGLGGFPIATQESVLSLMSGGYDSGVASFQFIKRGSRVHYCFFNLGGREHEAGVREVVHYLWQKYGASHRVKFISVPFEGVVTEILDKIDKGHMGVVLKRMMMRAGAAVAEKLAINALVTGESMGQVSSQTVTNLNVIDRVTDTLILRPLIASDKQEIIDQARTIGTAPFAEKMPEYCGVISQKPTIKADLSRVEQEEARFDFGVLDTAIQASFVEDVRDLGRVWSLPEVEFSEQAGEREVILDIRAPEEEELAPLVVEGREVVHLPFFRLAHQFGELDPDKTYLLYCARGVMSRLQAIQLKEQGFENVKVYRP